ncbi:MAG: hypothetical protein ABI442_16340 [Gemmatimonadaceae bacterium]
MTVRATDFKFEAPSTIPSGATAFHLENAGKEVHHLWLVQIKDGHTYGDFVKAMDAWSAPKKPDWAIDVGGPNDVSPGMTASAVITLEPGKYAMVCYVPAADGRAHVMHGMFKEITVLQGEAIAAEPTPDITIKTTDYSYDISKPITAGNHVIRIENLANQSHEVVIGQLKSGKTMKQALDWLNAGQHGAAPVVAMGGASGLSKGRHQIITMDFEPGRYVLFCFIPDAKDGKPHTEHGMMKEFTVAATVAR